MPGDATHDEIQQIVGLGVAWVEVPNGDWQDVAKNDDGKISRESVEEAVKKYGGTIQPLLRSEVDEARKVGYSDAEITAYLQEHPRPTPSRTEKALWLSSILLVPPMAGYGVFFLVIPWVYRGFRPAPH